MLSNIKTLISELKKTPIKDVEFVDKKEYGFKNVENQIYIYIPKGNEYKITKLNSCSDVILGIDFVLVAAFNCIEKSELLKLIIHEIHDLFDGTVTSFKLEDEDIYFEETEQTLGHRTNLIKIKFRIDEQVDISCIDQICKECC